MVDLLVPTNKALHDAHYATEYLKSEAVATAIGFALHGSLSREVVVSQRALDVPLTTPETLTVLALRYAHLIRARLQGDVRARYIGALRSSQAHAIASLLDERNRLGQPVPSQLLDAAFDFSNPDASAPEPHPIHHVTREAAPVLLLALASANVIAPFSIELPKGVAKSAMQDLTAEMNLGSPFGASVFDSLKQAHDVLDPGTARDWIKWLAPGAGAAALVVATGGLALAAAPGVAGAAAITSALAAFGPGGMVGGLLTAGTLVTAGGGGIAFGLASGAVTAEALEAVVQSRLAATILRHNENLTRDPDDWRTLVTIEAEVRRQLERLDEFSDPSARSLKDMRQKLLTVERAIAFLRKLGLEPNVLDESEIERTPID